MRRTLASLAALPLLAFPAYAQEAAPAAPPTFRAAGDDIRRQLEESVRELSALRESIAAEKLPLAREISGLETDLVTARQDLQRIARSIDDRTRGLGDIRNAIKARKEQVSYLASLLGEYRRNWEAGLHIAELQRYRAALEPAKLAVEDGTRPDREVFGLEAAALAASLERLEATLGGARYDGRAVDAEGTVREGSFLLVGPVALFRSADGATVGMAQQRLGSLEPSVASFEDPTVRSDAAALVSEGKGTFPFDPSLGNAQKIASTKETWGEHIAKGGPVLIPIFVLAGMAFLVVVLKWISFLFVRNPSNRQLRALLDAVGRGDATEALRVATRMPGPGGRMLRAGVEHLGEPRELVEEVMYERVLDARLRLNRFLPFVAICAASAPLLGLLGTVTGIMNTFRLIEVFGTGDVRTLSSGISEALITTEFGLIVAIPSLLLHAYLSRKARATLDRMETCGIAFMNQVARTPVPAPAPAPVAATVPAPAAEPAPAAASAPVPPAPPAPPEPPEPPAAAS